MKRIINTLIVGALFLLSASVAAQIIVPLPGADEAIVATFYDGNPFAGGDLVDTSTTVLLRDTSIGRKLHNIKDADYIVLSIAGTRLAFETWGITSTTSTPLKGINDGEYMLLGEVVQGIYDALLEEKELAIFTDADGVVKGFYSYYQGKNTLVDAPDAETLMHFVKDTCTIYEATNTKATRLDYVTVQVAGKSISLGRALVRY